VYLYKLIPTQVGGGEVELYYTSIELRDWTN